MSTEFLFRYFAGMLSEGEIRKIMLWVEASDENRSRLMRERKAFDLMMLQDNEQIRRIIAGRPRPKFGMRMPLTTLRRAAAMIAAAVIVSWGSVRVAENFRAYPEQTLSAPAGQRLELMLADGSKVFLNGRSSITYPLRFGRRQRAVKLDGQAYFEVAHDESSPFVVTTEKGRIEVLGTKFDVIDFAGKPDFEAALMEGKVSVALNAAPDKVQTITPDMRVYLKDGRLVREYIEDYYAYLWRDGLIGFSEASFGQIMEALQKNYDITVVVRNSRLGKFSYTGKFRTADGIDYALRVLQKDVPFNYAYSADHKTIYID